MTDFFHDHIGPDTHHHVPVPEILERYDFNGDGHVDAIAVDTDQDGRPDTWEYDKNYDGHHDGVVDYRAVNHDTGHAIPNYGN